MTPFDRLKERAENHVTVPGRISAAARSGFTDRRSELSKG
jgi:hypothetical protein